MDNITDTEKTVESHRIIAYNIRKMQGRSADSRKGGFYGEK